MKVKNMPNGTILWNGYNETYIFYMEEEKNFREKQKEVLQELLGEE